MKLDLNLLRIVLAVYETGSVVNAAQALGMSQPGVSTALQRAREALGDPLFTRTPQGMEPTARTKDMIDPIRSVLTMVERTIVSTSAFDPSSYKGEFRIALTDVGEATMLPRIIRGLVRETPHATVRSVSYKFQQLEEAMADGFVDLAAGYFPDFRTASFYQQLIGTHSFACLMRADHPIGGDQISLAQFMAYGHVVAEFQSRSQEVFDEYVKREGIARRIVLRTPHFMSIPAIVSRTDLIATVPRGLSNWISRIGNPKVITPEFPLPTFDSKIFWHRSVHHDPRNKWLRQLVLKEILSGD